LPVKLKTQNHPIEQVSPRNYWLSTADLKNRGLATRFSPKFQISSDSILLIR